MNVQSTVICVIYTLLTAKVLYSLANLSFYYVPKVSLKECTVRSAQSDMRSATNGIVTQTIALKLFFLSKCFDFERSIYKVVCLQRDNFFPPVSACS